MTTDGRDRPEELDRREEEGRELLRVDVRDAVGFVQLGELRLKRSLAAEGLNDGHAGDGLGKLGRDGGDPCSYVGERDVRRRLEPPRDDDAGRQDDQRDDPESPVENEQPDDRGHERHGVDDQRCQPLVEHVRERVDVARQPRNDPARLLLREVPQGEGGEVLEEVATEIEHDLLSDPREHQPRRRPDDPGGGPDSDVEDDVGGEARQVVGLDAVVDRIADDRPAGDRRGRRDGCEQHHAGQPLPATDGVAPEARQTGAVVMRQVPRPRRAR